jgi:hypothetical protein
MSQEQMEQARKEAELKAMEARSARVKEEDIHKKS